MVDFEKGNDKSFWVPFFRNVLKIDFVIWYICPLEKTKAFIELLIEKYQGIQTMESSTKKKVKMQNNETYKSFYSNFNLTCF